MLSSYSRMSFLFKGNQRTKLYLIGTDLQRGNKHLTSPGVTSNLC